MYLEEHTFFNAMTHFIGHILGLDHDGVSSSLMYGYFNPTSPTPATVGEFLQFNLTRHAMINRNVNETAPDVFEIGSQSTQD